MSSTTSDLPAIVSEIARTVSEIERLSALLKADIAEMERDREAALFYLQMMTLEAR